MSTRIHVSKVPYFCTDDKLRQAFIPFGTVVCAQVLRDECGHSLGLGVMRMVRSEDVACLFNEHQRFEISGLRVDFWKPSETEDPQAKRFVTYDVVCKMRRAVKTAQDRGHEKTQKALSP